MKANKKRDINKCGIYCIRNKENNKVYIGKSINIYNRIKDHIGRLNIKNKDENPILINSWHKYGRDSFEYFVLEYIDNTIEDYDKTLAERELFWIKTYDALNKNKGYNIRFDSKTKTIINSLSKKKMSDNLKRRWKEDRETMLNNCRRAKDNMSKEAKLEMALNVSKAKQKYYFDQYSKDLIFIKRWNSVKEIIKENPSYKWNNIYAACSGEKPTIYGFIWKKVLKEDIVQS